ncbi:MAG: MFS transporter [Nannocystaceae bacterium]|nr:MFS transporter [bacterium]
MFAKARIALAFAAIFFALGMHMPYFPVWLQAEGYSEGAIGIVLGTITWMRVPANPLVGRLSDKLGSIKRPALVLAVLAASAYGLFGSASTLWQLVAVGALLGISFSPLIPLTDSVALRLGSEGAFNYGHLRLFGSAAFIAASNVGGWLLEHGEEGDVLDALRYALIVVVIAVVLMPKHAPAPTNPPQRRAPPRRSHWRFLITTGLLHASHAVLYAFGTAHWRASDVPDTTIGKLWSMGVIAEIVLFAFSARVQRRLGSSGLLALAAVGGLLRWPLLASTHAVPSLFGIQLLHALTFGALHLGAIAYVQERVDPRATATVTSLYAASSGVGAGLMMLAAGPLYGTFGGSAYWVMAGISLAGLLGARLVARQNDSIDTPAQPASTH